ncbi:hypothetical protein AB595_12725 [Massilia sp. WF1]|uniref:Ig-like domain-containing protein n=1 Tax=Massilia sp. WF1 TaxID=1406431 RepID=UPI00064B7566|nr:Ig-like domain-containing protein [Massilia sp. WF1]KLU36623.1 hypothetical protein AB595_12725 [Massilia sp. WF1]
MTDTDVAGNAGSKSFSFTLDTTAPAPTAALAKDSGSNGKDGVTNDASLTLSTLEDGATRVIKVDGTAVASYDPKSLKDGAHTVEVTDTDVAGNAGSKSFSFTLDTKGPAFTSAASASVAENIGANQLVYKAVASDDHPFSYSLGGADGAKFDIGADGSVTLKDNPNYEGTPSYNFAVLATDVAGNQSTQAVTLNITNVNEAPTAPKISGSTIENVPVDIHVADSISDPDAGDKLTVSLNTTTAKLSWANTDPKAPTTLTNPVTHVTVDLSTLSVKASVAADGTVTLTPPAELDWMTTGQALKATFGYTVTDAGGLSSTESIELVMNGSTTDKGVNLAGGNGDDVLSGNTTNNAEDVLQGNNGNDTLNGYGGTDVLYGGNGNDKLNGGAGIDYLYGDNGDDSLDGGADGDYLTGGKGNDILTGGTGADKFVFAPQSGNDRITDFKASDGDMLFLTDFFATAPDWNTFVSKYVTDTGNDLLVSLPGATIVLTGVPNISDLAGHVVFGAPV